MTTVLLIYPYFKPRFDRSVFRFPPLGISYIAASLRRAGHEVQLLDCTFLQRKDALHRAMAVNAPVVGIYSMATMIEDCLWFGRALRAPGRLLIAGGPHPTWDPAPFRDVFDVVVRGEGDQTILELLQAYERGESFQSVAGIAYRLKATGAEGNTPEWIHTGERPFIKDLDGIPFPARDLLPNQDYIRHGRSRYGYSVTTVLSTRGCPFRCEFCSNVVFGGSYRERSADNVVDEVEQALGFGYDRISFADDVFTLKKNRVLSVCQEIRRRGLTFEWECLGRVDSMDEETARAMKESGCRRIYFGIESGDARILELMNKKITAEQARAAVEAAHRAGLEVGAFFILFYPGETGATVAGTLRFAASLPVDYLGLSMPYPLPGTALYERVKGRINRVWKPGRRFLFSHELTYQSDFSEWKMQFGIIKGQMHLAIKRKLGRIAPLPLGVFDKITDILFAVMR
jgi:anaerobic magnesium-protoporphyrin IX monomethyl ester cyclase